MQALVVIDTLNDFLPDKIANPRAEHTIPTTAELLTRARANRADWLVVYANDAHLPSDFELPKRSCSSFHETGLDPLLRQMYRVETAPSKVLLGA